MAAGPAGTPQTAVTAVTSASPARPAGPAGGGWGHLEAALPAEWAAFIMILLFVTLLGGLVIAGTCVGHERRAARRATRRAGYERAVRAAGGRPEAGIKLGSRTRGPASRP